MMRSKQMNALLRGSAALLVLSLCACTRKPPSCEDGRPAYSSSDQPYIEKAYAYYYGHGDHIDPPYSHDQIVREVYPVVLNFRTAKCVGLFPRQSGSPGSSPTMCFARNTGKLVLTYTEDMIQEGPAPKLP